ncbi:MAG: CAP domain-containing protein, partial [Burkholderiales bacterium]
MTTILTTAPSVATPCRSRRSAALLLTSLTVLAATVAAPKHAVAQSPCARWDLSQGWSAVQSNGFSTGFTLQQSGPTLEGTGVVASPNVPWGFTGPFKTRTEGPVTGTTNGESIQLTTNWGGVYTGRIDFSGRIDGLTYDKRDSTSSARWYSDRRMNCLVSAGSTVPPVSTPPASRQPILVPDGTTGVLTSGRGAASAGVFGRAPAAAPAPASSPAPSPAPTPVLAGPHQIPIDSGRIIGRLLNQTNQYRSRHGVPRLEASAALTHAAQQYAEFLARTNTSGHSADGRSVKQR